MRKSQHLSVKCARAVTPKVVDVWIAYVKKLFQESGQCGHVSKDFSNRPWNCNETVFSISDTFKKVLAKRGSHEEGHKTGGGKWAGVHYCFWCRFGI